MAYPTVAVGRTGRRAFALALIIALLGTVLVPLAGMRATAQAASSLKAVIVVGPVHSSTSRYLEMGESLAQLADSYGMDVRRIFHPHATPERLKNAIQGANLVAYFGHGNGWPSPYAPFQEKTKNGMGLNPYDGADQNTVDYKGGNWFRNNVVLAENAVVLFNGLCYAEGNGEPGMGIPSWDVARQRVDNYAAAFLAIGAGAVFAYGWQSVNTVLQQLMTTDKTVDEIFMTKGSTNSPSSGFIGWDDRYFDSQRMPGFKNHLDPHSTEGYLRAMSGTMSMTAGQFRSGEPPSGGTDPVADTLSAPTDLVANHAGGGKVELSWSASTGGTGTISYRVFRNGTAIGTRQTARTYTDTVTTAGTYSYQVRAIDGAGTKSSLSAPVSVDVTLGDDVTTPDTVAPLAPSWMTATSLGYRRVELKWAAATDDRAGTLKYQLFRGTRRIATLTTLSYVDRPKKAGTKTYWVRAVDAAGNKGAWATVKGVAVKGAVQ